MTDDERKIFEAHERLKFALRLKGTSLAEIARSLGVSRTTLSLVGLRKLHNARVEQAIAEAVDLPVLELFAPLEGKEDKAMEKTMIDKK